MKRGTIIGIVLLAAIAGGVWGWTSYHRKPATAEDKRPQIKIDAVTLFHAFSTDERASDLLYVDKVVQVSGTVRDVSRAANGPVNVTLETGDPLGGVVCEFAADKVPAWSKGMKVQVKGFCAGLNMDVLLQRCSVVE